MILITRTSAFSFDLLPIRFPSLGGHVLVPPVLHLPPILIFSLTSPRRKTVSLPPLYVSFLVFFFDNAIQAIGPVLFSPHLVIVWMVLSVMTFPPLSLVH